MASSPPLQIMTAPITIHDWRQCERLKALLQSTSTRTPTVPRMRRFITTQRSLHIRKGSSLVIQVYLLVVRFGASFSFDPLIFTSSIPRTPERWAWQGEQQRVAQTRLQAEAGHSCCGIQRASVHLLFL
jgi:hypothetical protein